VTPRLGTDRLALVPLRPDDAREMVLVLADPALYRFIGGEPPTPDELEARYRRWVAGPPRPGETWHNWIVRLGGDRSDRGPASEGVDGPAIGHLQATVVDAGSSADIAWLIGTAWQGRGYAGEAARALVGWLEASGVAIVTAHVHPEHVASGRVAASAGLGPTTEMEEGEVVWRREAPPPG
jgi:RimJ/RimL family protein N-acetyltransferase